ncbi:hypothetical protein IFM89_016924 [Coptis chinensis]|uniref:chorismate synthase n=1 Tax=Coptis chinensis TaxID=261450 RepID=A0A835HTA8_9MAGN|nr:hypothetical protein IFM89_016924 [Coptis chinensis]
MVKVFTFELTIAFRRPGQSRVTSPRKETDTCRINSGVIDGLTTGTPIHVSVPNTAQNEHIWDLPKDRINKANMWRIGAELGTVMEVDLSCPPEFNKLVARVRVELDIKERLSKDQKVKLETGETITVRLKYEKLEVFCFFCVVIGHDQYTCRIRAQHRYDLLKCGGSPKDIKPFFTSQLRANQFYNGIAYTGKHMVIISGTQAKLRMDEKPAIGGEMNEYGGRNHNGQIRQDKMEKELLASEKARDDKERGSVGRSITGSQGTDTTANLTGKNSLGQLRTAVNGLDNNKVGIRSLSPSPQGVSEGAEVNKYLGTAQGVRNEKDIQGAQAQNIVDSWETTVENRSNHGDKRTANLELRKGEFSSHRGTVVVLEIEEVKNTFINSIVGQHVEGELRPWSRKGKKEGEVERKSIRVMAGQSKKAKLYADEMRRRGLGQELIPKDAQIIPISSDSAGSRKQSDSMDQATSTEPSFSESDSMEDTQTETEEDEESDISEVIDN